MQTLNTSDICQITWLIRRAFRLMGVRVDQYLSDLDVSACERSVIECLYPDQKMSVPQIAELYDVSRQHIQSSVNPLVEKKFAQLQENPRHKRSPLIALTDKGKSLFETIRSRDEVAFKKVFANVSPNDGHITCQCLDRLVTNLSDEIKRNNSKD